MSLKQRHFDFRKVNYQQTLFPSDIRCRKRVLVSDMGISPDVDMKPLDFQFV